MYAFLRIKMQKLQQNKVSLDKRTCHFCQIYCKYYILSGRSRIYEYIVLCTRP